MELTKFGLWIGRSVAQEQFGEAAQLAEELGYGALWVGGSRRLPTLRPMLEATERIVIASGIVNIWAYDDPASSPRSSPRSTPTSRAGCCWASASATPRRRSSTRSR